jgi:hypothetical protein
MTKKHITTWTVLFVFLIAGISGVPTWCFGDDGHVQIGDVSCCLESNDQTGSHCAPVADNAATNDECEGCVHIPVFAVGPNSSFTRVQHPSTPIHQSVITVCIYCAFLAANLRFAGLPHELHFVSSSSPASLHTVILLI